MELSKAKKQEIEKKAKEVMESNGVDYEEWRFQIHFDYLLNNLGDLKVPVKSTQGGDPQ